MCPLTQYPADRLFYDTIYQKWENLTEIKFDIKLNPVTWQPEVGKMALLKCFSVKNPPAALLFINQ